MQVFFFDCFAVLVDEYTLGGRTEPSAPEESPRLLGFFLTNEGALEHLEVHRVQRVNAHHAQRQTWARRTGIHLDPIENDPPRKVDYFIVPVSDFSQDYKFSPSLDELQTQLEDAARLLAVGIGGGRCIKGDNAIVRTDTPGEEELTR